MGFQQFLNLQNNPLSIAPIHFDHVDIPAWLAEWNQEYQLNYFFAS